MKSLTYALMLCLGLTTATLAEAALIDRGGGLIYDTDLNVTWLADGNFARTSGYDADGLMSWYAAITWAANLNYYDSVRNVTYSDWRLPLTLQPDSTCETQNSGFSSGLNCARSEMGHLFYVELGGVAGISILSSGDPDLAMFQNIQIGYWSATDVRPASTHAWAFGFINGYQNLGDKNDYIYAWAVRHGDVAAVSTVPVPAALWLFGSGLLALVARAGRPISTCRLN